MKEVRETQKKYSFAAITVSIIISLVFIFIDQKPIGKGLILGTLFSIINFVLIGETLLMMIGHSKRKTFFLSLGSIYFRYILLAVPLVIAIKSDQFNLVTVIFGIFSVQLIILADHFKEYILLIRNKSI